MNLDAIAAQVLDLVARSAPGAQAEVTVSGGELALTRFANSYIHQNVADVTTSVRLRLQLDGRVATGLATVAEGALVGLVDRTAKAARLAPVDPQWPGLAAPAPVGDLPPVDEATAHAEPLARAERVRDFVAAAGGLETAGYCSTMDRRVAFANSAGRSARFATTVAAFDGIARLDGADGVARLASARVADIDGARLGARAAAKARAAVSPRELPPGRYEVVLEPTAVVDLVESLASWGFNGKAVAEGRSFVQLGEAQLDPSISIVDDPFDPDLPVAAFDVEGTPTARLALVDAGVSVAVAHDRRTAARAGVPSTGHAIGGGAAFGGIPTHLRLLPAPGGAAPVEVDGPAADSAVAALVAGVERGLLVSDLWYTRVLDPRSLILTGLTRNGVWLIEDGAIVGPVQNFRFTQSYPRALAPGAVLAVGTHAPGLPGGWNIAVSRVPALRLASWNLTGNASG